MVKFKNQISKIQILTLFVIPLIPHYFISSSFHSDDLPIIFFLILFLLTFYTNKKFKIFYKELIPLIFFTLYIAIQNYYLNGEIFYSDSLRYSFYLLIFLTILNLDKIIKFENFYFYLLLFLTSFSILCYFLEIDLGTDAYDYWKIGFNSNEWGFTKGRINGFQAGGPNAFGGLIACLGVYCISNSSDIKRNIVIIFSVLGCFFTFSRASLIVLFVISFLYLIYIKNYYSILILLFSITFTLFFGLTERFSSELETEGIKDRVQMQQATLTNINERDVIGNLFGYGYGNYGVVRNKVKNINDFDKSLRPTGPHNSFLFMILNYGFIGFLLFVNIFWSPFISFLKDIKTNIVSPRYLFLGSFTALSFTGDFIQNHSISVIFFLTLFFTQRELK